jgi:hypothetical protein
MAIKLKMEIKDILKELILAANTELNHNGHPDNFDLEEFIYTLESYYEELDDLGELVYSESSLDEDFMDNDDDYDDNY